MSSLVRSHKALPPELSTVEAWKRRLRTEPAHVVLADAYEYNLWYLDGSGVYTITDHPIHEQSIENFLHSGAESYAAALVEVLRRRGHDPYWRLPYEAEDAGVPERAIIGLNYSLRRIREHQRAV